MSLTLLILVIIFVYLYNFCKDCSDTLVHHEQNVFTRINKSVHPHLYKYFNLDENWWKRKYINEDPAQGRKKFLFLNIPAAFFDAWHGFDTLRNLCVYHAIYCTFLINPIFSYPFYISYPTGLFLFSTITTICHKFWYEKYLKSNN